MFTILIVEDSKEILDLMVLHLEDKYNLIKAEDGINAIKIAKKEKIDLLILDIMLPLVNGYECMKAIREKKNIPIIIVSAKSTDEDKIIGLQKGADDYLAKPFNPLELVARVDAQLRRFYEFGSAEEIQEEVICFQNLKLDCKECCLYKDEEKICLTNKEYKLLKLLMNNPKRVFTKKAIFEAVWEDEYLYDSNTIMVYISKLLKRNGAWFEILNTDYERQYPRAEYKKYTSIEIIDIVNGNYEIDGKKYRGIVKKFYDEQNRQRIQVTFFPIDFLRVTPTINIPLEAESIHFLGIYIVGIILFGIGYCLTVFCVSKKIKVELTKPINLLKEAMKELGSGNYKKRLSFKAEYEFVEMANSFNCMAQEMEDAVKQKEEEERLRRQLISDISHDIRTPLTVVQGYLLTVINDLENSKSKNIEYLKRCFESSVEMEQLLQQLSDYNRMFRVDYKLNKELVDFTEFVKNILADQYHYIEVNKNILRVEVDEEERNIFIDKREMRRAIINLLNNAVQHNDEDTTIEIRLTEYDRKIYLVIADDGKKIPKDISSCMYEPFVKGDQSRNDSSNSGLGLAIVKKVLDAHEAAIYFEQPYKKYTKAFIIVMPVK